MALTCSACGMSFGSERELKEHDKMHMGGSAARQEFRCNACGGDFQSEADLKAHSAKAHRM